MLQLKILHAATKTWLNKINNFFFKEKEGSKENYLKM